MYNFDPYIVLLAIATNTSATYDWFCAPYACHHLLSILVD